MTISNFRSTEPLYIVIVRDRNADQMLRDWARGANAQVSIENGRMKIFEQRSLSLFQMQWSHSWDSVMIWDCWLRRHMSLD